MRRVPFAMLAILVGLGIQPATAELFQDNFNRSDGTLGAPWELLDQSLLYIVNQRLEAHADEYGLMLYGEPCPNCYCAAASLAADFGFSSSTDYGGRFQFFLGGGDEAVGYWGFIAKIGLDAITLQSYDDSNGEIDLVTITSPLEYVYAYEMVMAYDPVAQLLSLLVVEDWGPTVVDLAVPASSEPFCYCAVGIENLSAVGDQGWIDNAAFEYCCEPTAAAEFGDQAALSAWPRPFTSAVQMRATGHHAGAHVVIFDITGRRVATVPLHDGEGRWDGSGLPAGLYLARIAGSPEAETVRLIKLH